MSDSIINSTKKNSKKYNPFNRLTRCKSVKAKSGTKSSSFRFSSVLYEVQHSFSTFGVARNDFFEKIFKKVLQKFAIQCN